jgi:hypothetical protein
MSPAPPISLVPQSLDLSLYGGDGVELRMTVTDSGGSPVPLTPGTVDAQIRGSRTTVGDAIAIFSTDLTDGATGVVILSLTGTQTEGLHGPSDGLSERFSGVWDVQWTPDQGQPITLIQGKVDSALDVTRLP